MATTLQHHVGTATARAGLVGNPSDGYGGAVVAVPIPALTATVEVVDATAVRVVQVPPAEWMSVGSLVEDVARFGHEGGERLVTAAVARLVRWGEVRGMPLGHDVCELRWRTTVPRSVGLGGSSAIVVATLRALSERWQLRLEPNVVAALALAAERDDLGIAAGVQDRLVQAIGRPIFLDSAAGATVVEGVSMPAVRPLVPTSPLPLFVAWNAAAAAPSGRYHRDLRQRFHAADDEVTTAMRVLGELAREAAQAVERGDGDELARLVEASFDQRRRLGGVTAGHEALVEAARSAGLRAGSAGSGGAIVGVAGTPRQLDRLRAALGASGGDVLEFALS